MESRKTGLLRLRHCLETWEADDDARAGQRRRFAVLADPSSVSRPVVVDQLFQTPAALADRMAALLPSAAAAVLEPSAGLGRLYRAARKVGPDRDITLVELSSECCRELYREISDDPQTRLLQRDFLGCDPGELGLFGAVLMNPPFRRGTDVRHILHARRFLEPGGVLVALCYGGVTQRRQLAGIVDSWVDLPEHSFRCEGTDAPAALVTWRG
jgi:hypothetical protein